MTTDRTAEPSRYRAEFTDVPYAEFPEGAWTIDGPSGGVCTCDGPIDDRERDAKLIAASLTAMEALAAHLNVPPVALAELLADGGLVELITASENVVAAASAIRTANQVIPHSNDTDVILDAILDRLRTAGQSEREGEG